MVHELKKVNVRIFLDEKLNMQWKRMAHTVREAYTAGLLIAR